MASESSCVFCRIIAGEIPAEFAHRDESAIAITDANPQAPVHLLVIPTHHATDIAALFASASEAEAAKLFDIAARLGRQRCAQGFRLVVNSGSEGGQTVDHLHIHVLGGRKMSWPPG